MNAVGIVIVDGEGARREKLKESFGLHPDLLVLAALSSREAAIKELSRTPDVLLMNSAVLKQRTLSRFLRTVQTASPSTRLILLHEDRPEDDALIGDIRLGVRGYVFGIDPPALIAKACRAVANGHIWAERRVLEKTIARHLLLPETLQTHVPNLQPLTGREMDMLNMVMKGATNREIAEMSNISERTVKTHLYRVYRKLKVKSRAKAIALLSNS